MRHRDETGAAATTAIERRREQVAGKLERGELEPLFGAEALTDPLLLAAVSWLPADGVLLHRDPDLMVGILTAAELRNVEDALQIVLEL